MKVFLLAIFACLTLGLAAQEPVAVTERITPKLNYSILPLENGVKWETYRNEVFTDSIQTVQVWPATWWSTINENQARILEGVNRKNYKLSVIPRLETGVFGSTGPLNDGGFNALGGLQVEGSIVDQVAFNTSYDWGYYEFAPYMDRISDSLGVVPGFGQAYDAGKGEYYRQFGFNLAWRPSSHFNFLLGRGKNFIGEGYRSLFLSDYASNWNFLRLNVNVWRIDYTVLYNHFNSTNYPNSFSPTGDKYSTMHYLQFNITKWWQIGAFEAVVWQPGDSLFDRGYDVNYLNPIIFFRPVEFGLGSSDNSLIGFSSSVRPHKQLKLYGQVMLDEFKFDKVTASIQNRTNPDTTLPTGWWANKQAVQLGWKWIEPLNWKKALVLAEFNLVRPFMYTHGSPQQSYTHLNQPLAHPLGANFIEWIAMIDWQPNRWHVNLISTYSRKGYSNNLGNLGEDVLVTSQGFYREYGNHMLQGRRVDVANTNLTVGYDLVSAWRLRAEAGIRHRLERTKDSEVHTVIFSFGLRTTLWNREGNL